MTYPYAEFLRPILDRAGLPHVDGSTGARLTHRGLPLVIEVHQRVLRFVVPDVELELSQPDDLWLLDRITRDWMLGRAYLDPEHGDVRVAFGLYIGSLVPPPELIRWVLDHVVDGVDAVRHRGALQYRSPPAQRPGLPDVAAALTGLGYPFVRFQDRDAVGLRISPPGGVEVMVQLDVVDRWLLSLRAYPTQATWPVELDAVRAAQRLNATLALGSVCCLREHGRLLYRAVVPLDWTPPDAELVQFLLATVGQVGPQLAP